MTKLPRRACVVGGFVVLACLSWAPSVGGEATLIVATAELEADTDHGDEDAVSEDFTASGSFSDSVSDDFSGGGTEHAAGNLRASLFRTGDTLRQATADGALESAATGAADDFTSADARADLNVSFSLDAPTTVALSGLFDANHRGGGCSEVTVSLGGEEFTADDGANCGTAAVPARLELDEQVDLGAGNHDLLLTANSTSHTPTTSPDGSVRFNLEMSICQNEFTAGEDRINGTPDDDVLCGGGGGDLIESGGGNDTIVGGSGGDTIEGGRGADTIQGEGGVDTIVGDSLVNCDSDEAAENEDLIDGGDERDIIAGCGGADVIFGGEGRDDLSGEHGKDDLRGEGGRDALLGGPGDEVAIFGSDESPGLNGGGGADRLISGGRGDDLAEGGAGDDDMEGGRGSDKLRGEAGIDRLTGGADHDVLRGGDNGDLLRANDGTRDKVRGQDGRDRARVDGVDDVAGVEEIL